MQTNSQVLVTLANRDNGSDQSYILKQIEKGGAFLAQFADAIMSPEQIKSMNQKAGKRVLQALNFSVSGNVNDFDAVTAFMVSTIMLTKQQTITFKDAHFLCGVGVDGANHIKGLSRAKLARFIGSAGTVGTVTSKVSRTTGKGGFFSALGITAKGDKHSFTLTDNAKENKLLLAYAMQLEKMTDGAFALIQEKLNK